MASLTYTPRFGGFSFNEAAGISIGQVGETALNRAEFRTRLSGDGALFSRQQTSGIRISVKGAVYGADEGIRRTNEDSLRQAMANGRQLFRTWDDRAILCRLEREIKFGMPKGAAFKIRDFSFSLRSEWDSWEGAAVTDGPWNLTSFPTIRTLPAHSGTAKTFPSVSFENKGAAVSDKSILLSEAGGGQQLSLQGIDLQVDQILTVDMWDGRIGDGTASAPRIASVEGDFFTISPATTTSIEFAGNFTPNIDILVAFNHRYRAGT